MTANSEVRAYITGLNRELGGGDATEHTHRPALKAFIEALFPGVTATNEPKHKIAVGAPDQQPRRVCSLGLC